MYQSFLSRIIRLFSIFLILILSQQFLPCVFAQTLAPWNDSWLSPDQRADQLLAQMTLDEKIALMHGVAGSLYGGYIPANTRLGIPALAFADGSAGIANGMTRVTAFPAPVAAAASWDTALMQQYGTAIGGEARGKGANILLAPTVNILRTPQWGRSFESLGEDPYLTAQLASADIQGMQSAGIIATVKHYAANNQEYQRGSISAEVDERTLHEIYLPAFTAAVQRAHVGAVMCSYNKVNGIYACEQPTLLQSILKEEWGFRGLVMSDWGATHSTVASANAGLDMQMPVGTYYAADLKAAVLQGQISIAIVNEHVHCILRTMFASGLFDRAATGSSDANVATAADAKLARLVAERGTVLLKNERSFLPLKRSMLDSIAVVGPAASLAPKVVGGGSASVNPSYISAPLAAITRRAGDGVVVHYVQGLDSSDGLPVIDSQYTSPPPGSGSANGLQVQFFNNMTLSGTPVLTRVDPTIKFDWNGAAPAPSVASSQWSARWTGTLTAPVTAIYAFSLSSDDGSRLYLNNQLVIDNWGNHPSRLETAKVQLKRGQQYALRVEYYQDSGPGSVLLGWHFPGQVDPMITQAAQAAHHSDMAIVFANDNEAEAFDRTDLELPGLQDQLIQAVAQANPHTMVVLNTGGPVLMPWLSRVRALVETWYPGQEDGNALAAVLFGDINPAGKLPMTFPARAGDVPASTVEQYPGRDGQASYSEGVFVGYRHYDARNIEPLFPFGYGLSYTSFAYRNLSITRTTSASVVSLDVTNVGVRAGREVVQLYLGLPTTAVPQPPRQLKGFQPLMLLPGQTQHLRFVLNPVDLSYWDSSMHAWNMQKGTYLVMIGNSSRDIHLQGSLLVSQAMTIMDGRNA